MGNMYRERQMVGLQPWERQGMDLGGRSETWGVGETWLHVTAERVWLYTVRVHSRKARG